MANTDQGGEKYKDGQGAKFSSDFSTVSRETVDESMRPQLRVVFGMSGHEWEYVILFFPDGAIKDNKEIPMSWEQEIEKILTRDKGWYVSNRGNRLEIIVPPSDEKTVNARGRVRYIKKRTKETDAAVQEVLRSLVGEEFLIKFLD